MESERLTVADMVIRHQAADLVDLRAEVADLQLELMMAERDRNGWREMAQAALELLRRLDAMKAKCDGLEHRLRVANHIIRTYVLTGETPKAAG